MNTTDDEYDDCTGSCSLRGAIATAKQGDIIGFKKSITGTLTLLAELELDKNIIIVGPGSDKLTLDMEGAGRAMNIFAGQTVKVSGLTIKNGRDGVVGGAILNQGNLTLANCTIADSSVGPTGSGGGILNRGTLTLKSSTVTRNSAGYGGGIANFQNATLNITDSVISQNKVAGLERTIDDTFSSAEGGGIANGGTVTITNSDISNNETSGAKTIGGGISSFGSVTIKSSSITGNKTEGSGGGIFNGGSLTITNSTIARNSAGFGGAIQSQRSFSITFSTIAENSAVVTGGGLLIFNSSVSLGSTIVAGNDAPMGNDIQLGNGASLSSNGYNLIGDAQGIKTLQKNDQKNENPMLEPAAINGPGTTFTMAFAADSPVVGKGGTNCPPTDQRGVKRKKVCDVGAYELNP